MIERRVCVTLVLAGVLLIPRLEARGSSPLADIGPAPAVVLTDAAGKPFDLARLQGKVVLVSFVYTTCGGTCPATTHTLYRVQQTLKEAGYWGNRIEFVSITLDPARHTRGAGRLRSRL